MSDTKIHLIGNAHIDPVWFWRWQEGYAEIKASFRSALDRMEEYPDFIFTCSCASYYKWVEENCPEMFEEIVARVKEGRWEVVGGTWIEPDCNIPSGESFARHFLYSQNYFLEKFGVRATTAYNIDSFGHNASLPKLFAGSGLENYVMMRPGDLENPDVPGFIYQWESDDGSRVLTYRIPNSYNTNRGDTSCPFEENPDVIKLRDSIKRADEAGLSLMHFYGVGNHGGGPTIRTIETYNKVRSMEGEERIFMSSADSYFKEMQGKELPVWKNELQHHASLCYSAHSEVKQNNRKAENRLIAAETLAVMAQKLCDLELSFESMDKAWQHVLFNQFHDIICGCSAREAYEDAREMHGSALTAAAETINAAAQKISWAIDTSGGGRKTRSKESDWSVWELDNMGTPIVVFNPLSWRRKIPVQLGRPLTSVTDEKDSPVPVQLVRASRTNRLSGDREDKSDSMFVADVPAMGWRVYWVYLNAEKKPEQKCSLLVSESSIENENIKLEIEPHTGYVTSLYNKKLKQEFIFERACVPLVIDVHHSDTWGHMLFSFRDVVGRFIDAEVQVLESGPLRAKLRVTSFFGKSTLRQDFTLYEGASEVEVDVKLDWQEKFKLLKLSFPVNVSNPKVNYDVPFGHLERPANGTEESGQMWFDVSGDSESNKCGLAILNDGKYSFDVLENDMRMTVANSSLYADHYAGDFRDGLAEHLDQGVQEFRYALLPHAGDWREASVHRAAMSLNTEEIHVNETYHEGPLPQCYQGIELSDENVIVSALKPAMNGNGQILRLFEALGRDSKAEVKLPLLEQNISLDLSANSIRTLRINNGHVQQCDLTEHPIK